MKCIIVGSGPSAKNFTQPEDVVVFQVNGQIEWLNRADHWFTLDFSDVNMKRMKNQREGVKYWAACPRDIKLPDNVNKLVRIQKRTKEEPKDKYSPQWYIWRYSCVPGINKNENEINTGNSQWGAIQLAYKLGYKNQYLIGIDCTQEQRIEGGIGNPLLHLPILLKSATIDIKLYSGSNHNDIEGITKIQIDEWIEK